MLYLFFCCSVFIVFQKKEKAQHTHVNNLSEMVLLRTSCVVSGACFASLCVPNGIAHTGIFLAEATLKINLGKASCWLHQLFFDCFLCFTTPNAPSMCLQSPEVMLIYAANMYINGTLLLAQTAYFPTVVACLHDTPTMHFSSMYYMAPCSVYLFNVVITLIYAINVQ